MIESSTCRGAGLSKNAPADADTGAVACYGQETSQENNSAVTRAVCVHLLNGLHVGKVIIPYAGPALFLFVRMCIAAVLFTGVALYAKVEWPLAAQRSRSAEMAGHVRRNTQQGHQHCCYPHRHWLPSSPVFFLVIVWRTADIQLVGFVAVLSGVFLCHARRSV